MNDKMRNLTLAAAALAALTVTAPKASAQQHQRGGGRGNAPQQSQGPAYRGNENHGGGQRAYGGPRGSYGHGRYGASSGYGHGYAAPVRPYVRYGYGYGYGHGYAAPFRIFSGFRFYSAYPGPGYVYIADLGWVVPPFFGAVWIPGHYDVGGYWVDGFWR